MCKLSIIIPVFNVEEYIEQCLNSILIQTYSDFEVICVEDGSKDSSLLILEKYAKKDDRIKIYYNVKNSGQSFSRNKGLQYAVGEYVLFVDSDDFLAVGILDKIIEEADVLQAEVLSFDAETFDEIETKNMYIGIRNNEYSGIQDGTAAYKEQVKNGDYKCCIWQYLYRRDFLQKNKLYFVENRYHEDEQFMFLVYMNVKRIAFLKEVGYMYRIRANSTMTDTNKLVKRIKDLVYLYQLSLSYYNMTEIKDGELLAIHLDNLRKSIITTYHKCSLVQQLACRNCDDMFLKHIFYSIINMYEELELELDEIEHLRKQKKLYLYGAGEYAKRWISVLNEYNIEIHGIIVSKLGTNKDKIFGYTIYEVDKLCSGLKDNISVILAVHKNKICEIKDVLSKYQHVIIFDHK